MDVGAAREVAKFLMTAGLLVVGDPLYLQFPKESSLLPSASISTQLLPSRAMSDSSIACTDGSSFYTTHSLLSTLNCEPAVGVYDTISTDGTTTQPGDIRLNDAHRLIVRLRQDGSGGIEWAAVPSTLSVEACVADFANLRRDGEKVKSARFAPKLMVRDDDTFGGEHRGVICMGALSVSIHFNWWTHGIMSLQVLVDEDEVATTSWLLLALVYNGFLKLGEETKQPLRDMVTKQMRERSTVSVSSR